MAAGRPGMPAGMIEEASMGVAASLVASIRREKELKAAKPVQKRVPPPPPKEVRAVLLIQSMLRRREFYRSFGSFDAGDEFAELAPPAMLAATALYFSRRMRNPKFVDMSKEATAVAGLLSDRRSTGPNALKMDEVQKIVAYYEDTVPRDHMSMNILREKLDSLVAEAAEALYERCVAVDTPSDCKRVVDTCRREFDVPKVLEERTFEVGYRRVREVSSFHEKRLRKEFALCTTVLEFDALIADLEKTFGEVETELREEVTLARARRIQFLEQELETKWSRPFAGPLAPHSAASMRYQIELGATNPKVMEFMEEEKRHKAGLEAGFDNDVLAMQAKLRALTKRRKEARVRAIIEDLDEKISFQMDNMQSLMERGILELGAENEKVALCAKNVLSFDAHVALYTLLCERTADELKVLMEQEDSSPEAADRLRSKARQLTELLNHLAPEHPLQAALQAEFDRELNIARASAAKEKEEAAAARAAIPPTGAEFARQAQEAEARRASEAMPLSAVEAHMLDEQPEKTEDQIISDRINLKAAARGLDAPAVTPTAAARAAAAEREAAAEKEAAAKAAAAAAGLGGIEALPRADGSELSTEREPEEEDLWTEPLGFKATECAPEKEKVHVKEKANGGLGDLSKMTGEVKPFQKPEDTMDTGALEMLQSFDAEDTPFKKQERNQINVQLHLKDQSMDIVKLHTEDVFGKKFCRAIADALNVDRQRIKVLSFKPGVKVMMSILEPRDIDRKAEVPPPSASLALKDLKKQLDDPSSNLRTSEIGPFLCSAEIQEGVADSGYKMPVASLAGAYAAPKVPGTEVGKPAPKQAWGSGPLAGQPQAPGPATTMSTGAGLSTGDPTSSPNPMATMTVGGTSTWGASRLDMRLNARSADARTDPTSALLHEQTFRTTCPRAEEDKTAEKWATPFAHAPLYTYYDETKEAMAKKVKAESLKMAPAKEKFTAHASFKLTRHPTGGTERLKDYKFGQPQQFSAVDTWVEPGKKEQDPLKQQLAKELGQAKEGAADFRTRKKNRKKFSDLAKDVEEEDDDVDQAIEDEDDGTPTKDKGKAKKKPAKKKKERRGDDEPETEPGAMSPADQSPRPDGGAKKGKTRSRNRRRSDLPEEDSFVEQTSDAASEKSPTSGGKTRRKPKQKSAGRERTETAETDLTDDGTREDDDSPVGDGGEKKKKKKRRNSESREKKGKSKRPGTAATEADDEEAPTESQEGEEREDLSALYADMKSASKPPMEITIHPLAGLHGGIPGTGLRRIAEAAGRLPSIGSRSVDDLRSPAFVREQYRFESVKVGPPYRIHEQDEHGNQKEDCPAWTAYQMLDATLDKNDWHRSYIAVTKKNRGRSTGPKDSIREIGRAVSLPRLRGGSKPGVPRQSVVRRMSEKPSTAHSQPPRPSVIQTAKPSTAEAVTKVEKEKSPKKESVSDAESEAEEPEQEQPRPHSNAPPAGGGGGTDAEPDASPAEDAATATEGEAAKPTPLAEGGTAVADAIDPSETPSGSKADKKSKAEGKKKSKRDRIALKSKDNKEEKKAEGTEEEGRDSASSKQKDKEESKKEKKEKKEKAKEQSRLLREEEERKAKEKAEAEKAERLKKLKEEQGADAGNVAGWEAGTETVKKPTSAATSEKPVDPQEEEKKKQKDADMERMKKMQEAQAKKKAATPKTSGRRGSKRSSSQGQSDAESAKGSKAAPSASKEPPAVVPEEATDSFELVFPEAKYDEVDLVAFEMNIRTLLKERGASEEDVSKIQVTLRAGSIIAQLDGPLSVIGRMKALDLDSMEILGHKGGKAGSEAAQKPIAAEVEAEVEASTESQAARDIMSGIYSRCADTDAAAGVGTGIADAIEPGDLPPPLLAGRGEEDNEVAVEDGLGKSAAPAPPMPGARRGEDEADFEDSGGKATGPPAPPPGVRAMAEEDEELAAGKSAPPPMPGARLGADEAFDAEASKSAPAAPPALPGARQGEGDAEEDFGGKSAPPPLPGARLGGVPEDSDVIGKSAAAPHDLDLAPKRGTPRTPKSVVSERSAHSAASSSAVSDTELQEYLEHTRRLQEQVEALQRQLQLQEVREEVENQVLPVIASVTADGVARQAAMAVAHSQAASSVPGTVCSSEPPSSRASSFLRGEIGAHIAQAAVSADIIGMAVTPSMTASVAESVISRVPSARLPEPLDMQLDLAESAHGVEASVVETCSGVSPKAAQRRLVAVASAPGSVVEGVEEEQVVALAEATSTPVLELRPESHSKRSGMGPGMYYMIPLSSHEAAENVVVTAVSASGVETPEKVPSRAGSKSSGVVVTLAPEGTVVAADATGTPVLQFRPEAATQRAGMGPGMYFMLPVSLSDATAQLALAGTVIADAITDAELPAETRSDARATTPRSTHSAREPRPDSPSRRQGAGPGVGGMLHPRQRSADVHAESPVEESHAKSDARSGTPRSTHSAREPRPDSPSRRQGAGPGVGGLLHPRQRSVDVHAESPVEQSQAKSDARSGTPRSTHSAREPRPDSPSRRQGAGPGVGGLLHPRQRSADVHAESPVVEAQAKSDARSGTPRSTHSAREPRPDSPSRRQGAGPGVGGMLHTRQRSAEVADVQAEPDRRSEARTATPRSTHSAREPRPDSPSRRPGAGPGMSTLLPARRRSGESILVAVASAQDPQADEIVQDNAPVLGLRPDSPTRRLGMGPGMYYMRPVSLRQAMEDCFAGTAVADAIEVAPEARPDSPSRRAGAGPGVSMLLPTHSNAGEGVLVAVASAEPSLVESSTQDAVIEQAKATSTPVLSFRPDSPTRRLGMGPGMYYLTPASPTRGRERSPPARSNADAEGADAPTTSAVAEQKPDSARSSTHARSEAQRPDSPSRRMGAGPGMNMLLPPHRRAPAPSSVLVALTAAQEPSVHGSVASTAADLQVAESTPVLEMRPDSPTRRLGMGPGMYYLTPAALSRARPEVPAVSGSIVADAIADVPSEVRMPSSRRSRSRETVLVAVASAEGQVGDENEQAEAAAFVEASKTPVLDIRAASPTRRLGMGPGMYYMTPVSPSRRPGTVEAENRYMSGLITDIAQRATDAVYRDGMQTPVETITNLSQCSSGIASPLSRGRSPSRRASPAASLVGDATVDLREMPNLLDLASRRAGLGPGLSQLILQQPGSARRRGLSLDSARGQISVAADVAATVAATVEPLPPSPGSAAKRGVSLDSAADHVVANEASLVLELVGVATVEADVMKEELPKALKSIGATDDLLAQLRIVPDQGAADLRGTPASIEELRGLPLHTLRVLGSALQIRGSIAAPASPGASAAALPARAQVPPIPRRQAATNSGATRQQVHSFAQTLTANIFRQSQSMAAQRVALTRARPSPSPPPAPAPAAAAGAASSSSAAPARPPAAPSAQASSSSPLRHQTQPASGFRQRSWGTSPSRTMPSQVPSIPLSSSSAATRPGAFRSGPRSPIPTEEDAFL